MKKYPAVENEVIPTRESDFFNLAINSISPVKALLQRNPEKIMLWEGHEKKLADEKIKSDFIEKLENLQYEGKPVVQMNITSISPNMYTTTELNSFSLLGVNLMKRKIIVLSF